MMQPMFKKDAVKKIRTAMEATRIYTYEVAKMTGYTRQYVSNILCGNYSSDRAIMKIANALGIDYKTLLK